MGFSWDSTMTCSNEYWQCATPAVGLLQGAAVLCSALPHPAWHELFRVWRAAAAALSLFYSHEKRSLWRLNFVCQVFRGSLGLRVTCTLPHTLPPSLRPHPNPWVCGTDGSTTQGAPGIIQSHPAVEMQVSTTPMSITITSALCGIPTVPPTPIWQPLVGGSRTGNSIESKMGTTTPRYLSKHHFYSAIAPFKWWITSSLVICAYYFHLQNCTSWLFFLAQNVII